MKDSKQKNEKRRSGYNKYYEYIYHKSFIVYFQDQLIRNFPTNFLLQIPKTKYKKNNVCIITNKVKLRLETVKKRLNLIEINLL